jgi:hypothetical protein
MITLKLPVPTKEDMINWVTNSYDRISEESARKTYTTNTNLQTINNNKNDEDQMDFHDLYICHP